MKNNDPSMSAAFLNQNRSLLLTVVASVMILFGVVQLAGIQIPGLSRTARVGDAGRVWTVYVLGTAYGVAGVCTGPILGSVLMVAASRTQRPVRRETDYPRHEPYRPAGAGPGVTGLDSYETCMLSKHFVSARRHPE